MGSNNNDKKQPQQSTYNPTATTSGNDPRGRVQNRIGSETARFQNQQGPVANQMAYNYARGSEQNIGDYTDMMNQYRSIYAGEGGGGSGAGGGGYSEFDASGMYTPFLVSYDDPFNSYSGFQEFSNTGGYSPADMANMRARGMGPIRSAYADADRELARQRSLQGGYAPNAIAVLAKMARERGQGAADAVQNIEAGIIQDRNRGKLAGLTGMSGIEGQRLGAQIDVGKYNAGAQQSAQSANIGAAAEAAANSAANSAALAGMSMADRFNALQGGTSLYGTTPGLANTFGNQLNTSIGQGANFGLGMTGREVEAQGVPGRFDTTVGRAGQLYNLGSQVAGQVFRRPQQTTQSQTQARMPGTTYNEVIPRPARR